MSYIISPIVNCSGIMNFGFDNPCIYLDPLASSIITGSLVGNLATACLLHITRYYKLNRSLKHNLYSFKSSVARINGAFVFWITDASQIATLPSQIAITGLRLFKLFISNRWFKVANVVRQWTLTYDCVNGMKFIAIIYYHYLILWFNKKLFIHFE